MRRSACGIERGRGKANFSYERVCVSVVCKCIYFFMKRSGCCNLFACVSGGVVLDELRRDRRRDGDGEVVYYLLLYNPARHFERIQFVLFYSTMTLSFTWSLPLPYNRHRKTMLRPVTANIFPFRVSDVVWTKRGSDST